MLTQGAGCCRGCIAGALSEEFGAPEYLSAAEGNGWRPEKGAAKVDALKGSLLRVQGLPSLLQIHLKRFQYDWQTDRMSKLNNRFAFPKVIAWTSVFSMHCSRGGFLVLL